MKRIVFLGLLALSMFAVDTPRPAAAWACPSFTEYCSRASDCLAYCGFVSEWAVCDQGCCACLG